MKKQLLKKPFAFIIAIMMFSVMPEITNAQKIKPCVIGQCPSSFTCVDGYCVKIKSGGGGGGGCDCFHRPIPFECGQICGFLAGKTPANNLLSITGINSVAISFELIKAQNVSLKIYNIYGSLIKTLASSRMPQGESQIEWNRTDEKGNNVSAGIYFLKLEAGNYSDTKKFMVIK